MEDIKEKTADEMFEELGYEKSFKPFDYIKYYKDDDNVFHFNYISQDFNKSGEYDGMCDDITMQELQAINKKCKEMNWLGDE
jgi:hypothetical protein